MASDRGFKELPHTADRAMRVWAPDPAGLFAEAARGMYILFEAQTAPDPATPRTLEAAGPDLESLLVSFLSELIYAAEQEHLIFTWRQGKIVEIAEGWILNADMAGTRLLSMKEAVKAVTYHKMRIARSAQRCEVEIVFDV